MLVTHEHRASDRAAVDGPVTISAGIGFAANAADVEPAALFEAAGRALYEAKAEGRNRAASEASVA